MKENKIVKHDLIFNGKSIVKARLVHCDVEGGLKYEEQTLTEDQQEQARENIGAEAEIENIVVQVDNTVGTPAGTGTLEDGTLTLSFTGLKGATGDKGDQGNTGSSVDYPYELVNNRTTDDATKGLSAAEGKRLGDDLSQLSQKVDELDNATDIIQNGVSATSGGLLKASDGTIVSNQYVTANGVTDFIPTKGTRMKILRGGYQGAIGTYALICFYTSNSESSFLDSVRYTSQSEVTNFSFIIPDGAKYCRISMADHGGTVTFIFSTLQEQIDGIIGDGVEIVMQSNSRYLITPSSIGSQIPAASSTSGYECAIVKVTEGDIIRLTAGGSSAARTFAFADSNRIITRVGPYSQLINVDMTIPSGVSYFIINNTITGAKSFILTINSVRGDERQINAIKEEQVEQNADLVGLVGTYTRPDFYPVVWGSVTKDKYWNLVDGSAGMVSASEYYAKNELLSVTPGKKLKITVISALYTSLDAAFSGYDNDGEPAYNGSARKNYSTADSATVNSDGTTTYVFTLGANVTQVGLFFKNVETSIEIEKAENRQYSEDFDEHIQLVAGGGDTTSADSAKYYLKGASPKSFSKKVCIIAAGQSNIDGRDDYADMPAEIKSAQPITNCHYVKNSESDPFSALNITGQWAFDLVTYYNIALARELYVIKWSVGGTSIDPEGDGTYHWTADYEELDTVSHSLLRKFENEIRNHIASDGNDFDIRAMLWHQGEGDRGSLGTGSADRYYDNLRNMISYIRGVVGNERLPIVTATISEYSSQYDATIHAAQVRLASEDPYFVLIDMSGAPLKDSYHFNATSSVYLGQMAYNALIDLGVITGTKLTPVRPW